MAAWEGFDWDNVQTRVRAKSSVTPNEQDVRSILKVINGLDKVQDVAPQSVSGKCHYYTKVFFNRTPWMQAICFLIFIVTFSLTVDGLISIQEDLDEHSFESKTLISANRTVWLIIILSFCIVINLLVYIFSLFGSQFCLAKRFSKWGNNFICSLYFLRMFEGFLFFCSCVVLFMVSLDGIGLVSNSNTIASMDVICKSSGHAINAYTKSASSDAIVSAFLDIKAVQSSMVDVFCADIKRIRDGLPTSWYSNFIALVAQVFLTMCAYQNYMITKAVWESSLYGSEVELELEKRRSEREAAQELKKQQKQQKKLAKKNLEDEMAEKRFPTGKHEKKNSVRSDFSSESVGPKRMPAYGGSSVFSAYGDEGNNSTLNYVSDSDSDFGGACDLEDNPTRESSTTMTNNAFDGGEWWKE